MSALPCFVTTLLHLSAYSFIHCMSALPCLVTTLLHLSAYSFIRRLVLLSLPMPAGLTEVLWAADVTSWNPSSRPERGVSGGKKFGSVLCDPWTFEECGSVAGVSIMYGGLRFGFPGVGCRLPSCGTGIYIDPRASTVSSSSSNSYRLVRYFLQ
jgi:hypothetical protein